MLKEFHSEGPWGYRIGKKASHAKISCPHWNDFATVIIKMNGESSADEEGMANLKLIISAPEMYEENKKLRLENKILRRRLEHQKIK